MPFKQIGSPHPKYLSATDVLIGDMSDTNYEFLLFNRPIILLANKWLRENFPDIGIKTDLDGLDKAIKRSIDNPAEYEEQRRYWLKKTIHKPDGHSSERVIDAIIKHSKIENPKIVFIHGNSSIIKNTLNPLSMECRKRGIDSSFIRKFSPKNHKDNFVYISAHNTLLKFPYGYKVHIDHGLKGEGVTDFKRQIIQYQKKNYHPSVDLHITEGEVSYKKTKLLLGPYSNRTVMVGYPKADDFIRLNTKENKGNVFDELGFDKNRPLITYSPAGKRSYPFKQGASLSKEVVDKLKQIAFQYDYNILIKLKYPKRPIILRAFNKFKKLLLK